MPFPSILFEQSNEYAGIDAGEEPPFFTDLNLDQVMASMTASRDEYNLAPYFLTPLQTVSAVDYRHQILHDLEEEDLRSAVDGYARGLSTMRSYLVLMGKLHNQIPAGTLVPRCGEYLLPEHEVIRRADHRAGAEIKRLRRLPGIPGPLYAVRRIYPARRRDHTLLDRLAAVRYAVNIKGNRVRVTAYEGEEDYGADVEQTFAKFKQGAVKDYRVSFRATADMDHVEAQVLELVGKLYPETFARLDDYCARHARFADDTLAAFGREVQFYLALPRLHPADESSRAGFLLSAGKRIIHTGQRR